MNKRDKEKLLKLLNAYQRQHPEIENLQELKEHLKIDVESKELKNELLEFYPEEIRGELLAYALYSDGACRGNPGPGAYGYLIQDVHAHILATNAESFLETTNNIMELKGVIEGLKKACEIAGVADNKLVVVTDSQYVIKGLTEWAINWERNGWRKSDGKTPENIALWQELWEIKKQFVSLQLKWVKGHAGHPQNEYCDRIANEALDLFL